MRPRTTLCSTGMVDHRLLALFAAMPMIWLGDISGLVARISGIRLYFTSCRMAAGYTPSNNPLRKAISAFLIPRPAVATMPAARPRSIDCWSILTPSSASKIVASLTCRPCLTRLALVNSARSGLSYRGLLEISSWRRYSL